MGRTLLMNKQERQWFGRMAEVLRLMASDSPNNPCDISRVSSGNRRQTKAAGHLLGALNCIGYGDNPEDHIIWAEQIYQEED